MEENREDRSVTQMTVRDLVKLAIWPSGHVATSMCSPNEFVHLASWSFIHLAIADVVAQVFVASEGNRADGPTTVTL
jgi:hypothetical protein